MNYVGICGTFDYYPHEEHYKFVEFASGFGNVLVFVTNDRVVEENKGHRPYFKQSARVSNVRKIPRVTAVLGTSASAFTNREIMLRQNLSHYVFGPGQNTKFDIELRKELERNGVVIVDWDYRREIFTSDLLKEKGLWEGLQINNDI